MRKITKFEVNGLFGTKNVSLRLSEDALILVGPNGIGKSSVANIFYFFVSRQWSRLLDYRFHEISMDVGNISITVQRDEIAGLAELRQFPDHLSPTIRRYFQKLSDAGLLEKFLSDRPANQKDMAEYTNILGMPRSDIPSFKSFIKNRFGPTPDLFLSMRINIEKELTSLTNSRVVYLPTFRRIEKELKEIFPDVEERYRERIASDSSIYTGRSSAHYVELISFGMEDVKKRLLSKAQELRDYSLSQHNDLSAIYLRDVIHGKADEYVAKDINSMTDEGISKILDRVREVALSSNDKELIRMKVKSIQGKRKSEIGQHDRFLAHYFSRLVSINADIGKREHDIKSFVVVCNNYLKPTKHMVYDETTFEVNIIDEDGNTLDLGLLSSGEKQVIAIFSHLYLDNAFDQIIVIDEPELSLSVPWQKRFLPDILDSGKCGLLLAVTHSPFIYANDLRSKAIDLRQMIKSTR